MLVNYRKGIYDHVIPVIGHEKLKNITPPMFDSLFAELQKSGNMEQSFRLKDKALLDGVKREELAEKAGVSRFIVYNALAGKTMRRENAEKIAAAMGTPLNRLFDDVTEKRELSGASTNKLKLNLSAIFTAAVKKEIMRRNPCRLAKPPKVDTVPAAYLNEEQYRELLDILSKAVKICRLKLSKVAYFYSMILKSGGRQSAKKSSNIKHF